MALGFQRSSGEDFLPSFRFNSISGDIIVASSVKNEKTNEWEKTENEVKVPVKFVFDLADIEIGWMHFSTSGPSFAMTKLGMPLPTRPTTDHKQGFRVKMFNKEHGLCVFSATSKTICDAMDELHDAYIKGEKENPNKVPVIEIRGTEKVPVKTRDGTKNFKKPSWSIVAWVTRPEQMAEKVVSAAVESDDGDEF